MRHRRFVAVPLDHLHLLSQQHRDAGDARRPGRTRREDRLSGQVEGVVVLFAVEPLVVQGPEGPFSDAVMARSLDPGADVTQLGVGVDEMLEPERAEQSTVVGDQGDRGRSPAVTGLVR